jgi:hypothetical protein
MDAEIGRTTPVSRWACDAEDPSTDLLAYLATEISQTGPQFWCSTS